MIGRLSSYVHVAGRVFGPADDVLAEVAVLIVNPKAWEGGVVPAVVPAPAPPAPDGSPPPVTGPPPKAGPGSSGPAWRDYAQSRGVVVVSADARRDDIIAAIDAAGVPTEGQE